MIFKWMWPFFFWNLYVAMETKLCKFDISRLCPHRETNLKVRQALTVTSELAEISKLMDFDGEMMLHKFNTFIKSAASACLMYVGVMTCIVCIFLCPPAVEAVVVWLSFLFYCVPQEKSFVSHQTTNWINLLEHCTGETINTLWIMKKCSCEVVFSETLSGALEWSSLPVLPFI